MPQDRIAEIQRLAVDETKLKAYLDSLGAPDETKAELWDAATRQDTARLKTLFELEDQRAQKQHPVPGASGPLSAALDIGATALPVTRLPALLRAAQAGQKGVAAGQAVGGALNIGAMAMDPIPSAVSYGVDELFRLGGRGPGMGFARAAAQPAAVVGGEEIRRQVAGEPSLSQTPADWLRVGGGAAVAGLLPSVATATAAAIPKLRAGREGGFLEALQDVAGTSPKKLAKETPTEVFGQVQRSVQGAVTEPIAAVTDATARAERIENILIDLRADAATTQLRLAEAKRNLRIAETERSRTDVARWQREVDTLSSAMAQRGTASARLREAYTQERENLIRQASDIQKQIRELDPAGSPVAKTQLENQLAGTATTIKQLDARFRRQAAEQATDTAELAEVRLVGKQGKPVKIDPSSLEEFSPVVGFRQRLDEIKTDIIGAEALRDHIMLRAKQLGRAGPSNLPPDIPNAFEIATELARTKGVPEFSDKLANPSYLKVALALAPQDTELIKRSVLTGLLRKSGLDVGKFDPKAFSDVWRTDSTKDTLRLLFPDSAGATVREKADQLAEFFDKSSKQFRLFDRIMEYGQNRMAWLVYFGLGTGITQDPLKGFGTAYGVGVALAGVQKLDDLIEQFLTSDRFRRGAMSWATTGDAGRLSADAGRAFNAWLNRDKPNTTR